MLKIKANCDDDRSRDNRREIAHDLVRAKSLEKSGQNQIDKTCAGNAEACIRKVGVRLTIDERCNRCIAAEESETRSEECRDLFLRDQVEKKCSESGEQKCRGNGESGQQRYQNRSAEHSKHVLQTKDGHLRGPECTSIVNGIRVFPFHNCLSHNLLLLKPVITSCGNIIFAVLIPSVKFRTRKNTSETAVSLPDVF